MRIPLRHRDTFLPPELADLPAEAAAASEERAHDPIYRLQRMERRLVLPRHPRPGASPPQARTRGRYLT